jgi:UDP-N-acetylglucosamine 2-epimerase (non-hydrolysing)
MGEPMERIFKALLQIAEDYAHMVEIIYPVHMNPNVTEHAYRLLSGVANIHLIQPLDYLPMVHLMKQAYLVLTDSGGLQEEAPALGTPVLVLREVTERPEAIEAGTAILVGTDPMRIVETTSTLLDDQRAYRLMAEARSPFGDGHASKRIVKAIQQSTRENASR